MSLLHARGGCRHPSRDQERLECVSYDSVHTAGGVKGIHHKVSRGVGALAGGGETQLRVRAGCKQSTGAWQLIKAVMHPYCQVLHAAVYVRHCARHGFEQFSAYEPETDAD